MIKASCIPWTSYFSRLLLCLLAAVLLSACSGQDAKKLKIGDKAPLFTLQDISGKELSLAAMKGSPVILRFFLVDCDYCRADTPVFNDYYARYHQQGLEVMYVESLGLDLKEVQAFTEELKISFPVAQDREKTVSTSYQVRALPQTVVLDPDHVIIAAILGGVSEAELKELLSPYLDKDKS